MRKFIFLFALIITLSSCVSKNEHFSSETVLTNVYVTKVSVYKYSKIQGYIMYNGIKLEIDNGNSGYYHKKYRINNGDVILRRVTVFQSDHYDNNPYKYSVLLSTSEIDFSDYEIK